MRILFINNDGAGFADYIEIAPGTSIRAFLEEKLPGQEASDLLIRVNRQPVPGDYILQDGDRISATPTKIAGASTI
jgi:sulfur carrier protein ThiS